MQPVLPGDSSDKIRRFEPSTLYYDRSSSFSHTEGQMDLVIALHMDVDRRAPPEHSTAFWVRAPPHTWRCERKFESATRRKRDHLPDLCKDARELHEVAR